MTTCTKAVVAAAVFGAAFGAFADAPSGYKYSQEITFSGYSGASTLENFPVLLKLPADKFKRVGCDDLAVTDGDGNRLAYEIDSVSGTNVLVWVKIPSLNQYTSVTAWFGKARADIVDFATPDVWTNAYAAVWHLNTDATDSTGHGLAQTVHDANHVSVASADISCIGRSLSLDGNDGAGLLFDTPKESFIDTCLNSSEKLTVSGWFRPAQAKPDKAMRLLCWKYNSSYGGFDTFQNTNGKYYMRGNDKNKSWITASVMPWEVSKWNHLAAVFNEANFSAYLNGSGMAVDPNYNETSSLNVSDGSNVQRMGFGNMGGNANGDVFSDYQYPFKNGQLDELRIYNGVASADWIKAESDTVRSNDVFSAYGEIVASTEPETDCTWTNAVTSAKWSVAGNWKGGVPASWKSSVAIFESGDIPAQTVFVDSPLDVGAVLSLDSVDRIITGDVFSFDEAEVSAGGTLTFADGYAYGDLRKSGAGTLVLSSVSGASAPLPRTVTVAGGVLAITDLALPLAVDGDFEPTQSLTGDGNTNDRQKYYNNANYFSSNLTSWTFGTDAGEDRPADKKKDSGIACNESYFINDNRIGLNGTYGHVALLRKLVSDSIGPGFVSRTVTTDHDNVMLVVRFQYNARGYKYNEYGTNVWFGCVGLVFDGEQVFDSGTYESDRGDDETKQWRTATVEIPVAKAGSHTLKFTALDATWEDNPVDSEVLIENVSIGVKATENDVARTFKTLTLDVAEGAKVALGAGVNARVRGFTYAGKKFIGEISALTHPECITGEGSLLVDPGFSIRLR